MTNTGVPKMPQGISKTFREFLESCLVPSAAGRKSIMELLEHPFILSGDSDIDPFGPEELRYEDYSPDDYSQTFNFEESPKPRQTKFKPKIIEDNAWSLKNSTENYGDSFDLMESPQNKLPLSAFANPGDQIKRTLLKKSSDLPDRPKIEEKKTQEDKDPIETIAVYNILEVPTIISPKPKKTELPPLYANEVNEQPQKPSKYKSTNLDAKDIIKSWGTTEKEQAKGEDKLGNGALGEKNKGAPEAEKKVVQIVEKNPFANLIPDDCDESSDASEFDPEKLQKLLDMEKLMANELANEPQKNSNDQPKLILTNSDSQGNSLPKSGSEEEAQGGVPYLSALVEASREESSSHQEHHEALPPQQKPEIAPVAEAKETPQVNTINSEFQKPNWNPDSPENVQQSPAGVPIPTTVTVENPNEDSDDIEVAEASNLENEAKAQNKDEEVKQPRTKGLTLKKPQSKGKSATRPSRAESPPKQRKEDSCSRKESGSGAQLLATSVSNPGRPPSARSQFPRFFENSKLSLKRPGKLKLKDANPMTPANTNDNAHMGKPSRQVKSSKKQAKGNFNFSSTTGTQMQKFRFNRQADASSSSDEESMSSSVRVKHQPKTPQPSKSKERNQFIPCLLVKNKNLKDKTPK
jgi:hypothetical protein